MVDTLVGQHVNPYPFIPFPPEVPPRPAPGHRTIMVVVLTGFADWGEFTMPLLTYLASCPDSIDVVALGKADNVDLSKSASQLNYSVLPAADSSPDRASLINQAWAHFQGSSQHEVLIVMQDDVQVYHGVFDTMAACFQQLPHTAVLGPLINAMNVGEKATDMDEKLLCWQNSHHRRTRKHFAGRMPKDCNGRLPFTLKEHNDWFKRSLGVAGTKNLTAPVDRLQSFFLAFRRDQPSLTPNHILQDQVNIFLQDFQGLYNPAVNGRVGDVETGRFSFLEDRAVPSHVCLPAFVYKDWTAEGLRKGQVPNDWFVPARRNPKVYPPPPEARWERV